MNYDRCYFDDDLRLYFLSADNENKSHKVKIDDHFSSFYRLIYLESSSAKVIMDEKSFLTKEPFLLVLKPEQDIQLHSVLQPCKILQIDIHPSVFENIADSDKVLEFFYALLGEQLIFRTQAPQYQSLKEYIDSILTALFAKCGRFSIETRVNALITELNLIYETTYTEYVKTTNSVPAQILDFVNKHYCERITLQTLSEKFFVSYNTINAIFKRITGQTFRKYITALRLSNANKLISSGNYTIQKVAQLSGFSEYPTFLRAYYKKFGIVPSKAAKNSSNYFPLK